MLQPLHFHRGFWDFDFMFVHLWCLLRNLLLSSIHAFMIGRPSSRTQSLTLSFRLLHLLPLLSVEWGHEIVVHWRPFHSYFVSNILHHHLLFVLVMKSIWSPIWLWGYLLLFRRKMLWLRSHLLLSGVKLLWLSFHIRSFGGDLLFLWRQFLLTLGLLIQPRGHLLPFRLLLLKLLGDLLLPSWFLF